jgi:hypothetical protein
MPNCNWKSSNKIYLTDSILIFSEMDDDIPGQVASLDSVPMSEVHGPASDVADYPLSDVNSLQQVPKFLALDSGVPMGPLCGPVSANTTLPGPVAAHRTIPGSAVPQGNTKLYGHLCFPYSNGKIIETPSGSHILHFSKLSFTH